MTRKFVGIGAAVVMTLGGVVGGVSSKACAMPTTVQGSVIQQKENRQLADEITRRLRRMGFNMIHSRTARPVETVGDYC